MSLDKTWPPWFVPDVPDSVPQKPQISTKAYDVAWRIWCYYVPIGMRRWSWRKWFWMAVAASSLAGCILNPQPEPPGTTGSLPSDNNGNSGSNDNFNVAGTGGTQAGAFGAAGGLSSSIAGSTNSTVGGSPASGPMGGSATDSVAGRAAQGGQTTNSVIDGGVDSDSDAATRRVSCTVATEAGGI